MSNDAVPTRETVGKISSELMQKAPDTHDPIALERAMQEDYMKELLHCIDLGYSQYHGSFFVVVITKNERLMPNVFRNYFTSRASCPTPDYDQTVFRYNREAERIEYIWTIPSKDACYHLKDNALIVAPEERELLRYVLEFADGTLFRVAKKWNSEQDDTPLLKKEINLAVTEN